MLRDITIGQYYPAESVIHKMDPRTKIIATLVYIISLFVVKNVIGLVTAALVLYVFIRISKVPLKFMLKGLKAIAFILAFTMIINMFMIKGEVLVKFWIFSISDKGLYTAIFMGSRLILLILGSSLMTLTTTPLQLTDGIEKLLRPLKKIKIPVHDIAMMMSIALRFIPILLEETDKIIKAQTARGADFESGNIIQKAKAMVPILVPLFLSAFRRAGDLATAMEARCYRGDIGRTRMKDLKYQKRDAIAFIILAVMLALLIGTRFLPGAMSLIKGLLGK